MKKNIEMNHPILLRYSLMIQRRSLKPVCDWPLEKAIAGDMACYKRHMGYSFDINNPVMFTEKLQWYKYFYHRDDFGQITDKYRFKGYIKEKTLLFSHRLSRRHRDSPNAPSSHRLPCHPAARKLLPLSCHNLFPQV